jgi:hypothetical protein
MWMNLLGARDFGDIYLNQHYANGWAPRKPDSLQSFKSKKRTLNDGSRVSALPQCQQQAIDLIDPRSILPRMFF